MLLHRPRPLRRARRWYDRQANRPTVRVGAAVASGVKAAAMVASRDPRYATPSAKLGGVTRAEHAALPLVANVVYPVQDSHWETEGEWTLDVGGQPEHAQAHHPSWVDALAAARLLPEGDRHDVVIRFRAFDGPGVHVFADDPLPVEERLERWERERRAVLVRERSGMRRVAGRKYRKRQVAAWEKEQAG